MVVTGLSADITTDKLTTQFSQAGNIQKSALVLDNDRKPTGKAYIVFSSKDSADVAKQQLWDGDVTVRAIPSSDRAEFEALIPQESPLEALLQAFQALSPADQAALFARLIPTQAGAATVKSEPPTDTDDGTETYAQGKKTSSLAIKPEPGETSSAPAPLPGRSPSSGVYQHVDGPVLLHEEPKLPIFSGSGKECTFGRWKYEVNCLEEDASYSASVVTTAVHKSLRSPAADVLCRLGINASSASIVQKLESIYGSVQSGETLLERFFSEPQHPKKENCAQWSCRLEDLIYQAAGKGAIDRSAVPKQLKKRFWSGLKDMRIKDALRTRVDSLSFEELLSEARVLEEEYSPGERTDAVLHQVTESDPKMDLLFQKIAKIETQLEQLQQQSKQKKKTKSSQPESKSSKDKVVKCEKCDQKGHLSFGCRMGTNVTCYKCNVEGHIAPACRNKHSDLNSQ